MVLPLFQGRHLVSAPVHRPSLAEAVCPLGPALCNGNICTHPSGGCPTVCLSVDKVPGHCPTGRVVLTAAEKGQGHLEDGPGTKGPPLELQAEPSTPMQLASPGETQWGPPWERSPCPKGPGTRSPASPGASPFNLLNVCRRPADCKGRPSMDLLVCVLCFYQLLRKYIPSRLVGSSGKWPGTKTSIINRCGLIDARFLC